ncbi:MAG: hypothetical protein LR015_02475 [Verrucomicrobia bacterium]|nr:hypothetical protein [Verrucomicrobiota bacterium]
MRKSLLFCPSTCFAGDGIKSGATASPGDTWQTQIGATMLHVPGHGTTMAIPMGLVSSDGVFEVYRTVGHEIGCLRIPVCSSTLEQQSLILYRKVLESTSDKSLYRVWNFVPAINAVNEPLEENYQLFCAGRSAAFEQQARKLMTQIEMPSASAVGHRGNELIVVYWAGAGPVIHLENPTQVPAWRYPRRYGRKPPSFARASVVFEGHGGWRFISGTASIKKSETLHAGDLPQQLLITLDNLEIMVALCDRSIEAQMVPPVTWVHCVRVYVREWNDLPIIRQLIESHFLLRSAFITYQHADICRSDLAVEIEMTSRFDRRK